MENVKRIMWPTNYFPVLLLKAQIHTHHTKLASIMATLIFLAVETLQLQRDNACTKLQSEYPVQTTRIIIIMRHTHIIHCKGVGSVCCVWCEKIGEQRLNNYHS